MTTTTKDTERRIYVADLAAYNAGTLHGVWIDADQDADAIEAEVKAMLRASKYPNICVTCPDCSGPLSVADRADPAVTPCSTCGGTAVVTSAEEWAVHDHEGFGRLVGESTSFADVAALAAALREHGEAFRLFLENGEEMPEAVERFEEAYCGEWDSERDYAEDYIDSTGMLDGVNDTLRNYFDYDAFTRDLFMDYWYEDGHVFRRM